MNQESKTYEIKLQSKRIYFSVPCSYGQVSPLTFRFPLIICTQNESFRSFICICSVSLFEKLSTKNKKDLCTHLQNLETPILIKIIINAETNTLFLSGIMDHVVQRDRNNSSNSFTGKKVTGKANSRCFKLYCSCFISYNLFNVGNSWR